VSHRIEPALRLNQILVESNSSPLDLEVAGKFAGYLDLLERWNARTNLTAIRDRDSILRRHFAESIICARSLPAGIASLLDFGSGAGFPGLPIALVRSEIGVTLAESQHKKVAFLREAVRLLQLNVKVHSGRAEELETTFDCVTLRAVDQMPRAISAALALVLANGWLAILTTSPESAAVQESAAGVAWCPAIPIAQGDTRILLLGQVQSSAVSD